MAEKKEQLTIHEKWQIASEEENGGVRIVEQPSGETIEIEDHTKK